MPLSHGDRVQLNRPGSPHGTVQGGETDGAAYVRLDSGTSCTFPTYELEKLPAGSKAWPPAGLETK